LCASRRISFLNSSEIDDDEKLFPTAAKTSEGGNLWVKERAIEGKLSFKCNSSRHGKNPVMAKSFALETEEEMKIMQIHRIMEFSMSSKFSGYATK
jgi:hypothetical protein